MNILFSDEKLFDIDGIYNSQNDRVWAVSRSEADKNGAVKQRRQFPQKVMMWLPVCLKGMSPMLIFKEGTVDHHRYIREVLSVALKCGNQTLGSRWTFEQDGARPDIHHLTQQWSEKNFPSFINKDQWPPSSPDLNLLDQAIWDELAQALNWDSLVEKYFNHSVETSCRKNSSRSCSSSTNRLYRMSKNNGDYLR